ncbi:MerR family transcriptional regulator [Mycobacterium sp. pW049]|uniref:MerR family transcriptional regulator n=1 Tax=[Mycobacterium] bulgaricum TaxID=3238985 RepID=UPI00351ABBCF
MAEYRIDDLVRLTGVTSRNIRAYQERGLLPKPTRSGRVAVYDENHRWTLEMIAFLLQKGYSIAHISDFMDGFDRNLNLADILGLRDLAEETGMEKVLRAPWNTSARHVEGPPRCAVPLRVDKSSELARKLLAYQIAREDGDDLVLNDAAVAERVAAAKDEGFYLRVLVSVSEATQEAVQKLADVTVDELRDRLVDQYGDGWIAPPDQRADLAATITDVRELGASVVGSQLNRALENSVLRVVGQYLEGVMVRHDLTSEELTRALSEGVADTKDLSGQS